MSGESGLIKVSVVPFVHRAGGVSADEIAQDFTFLVLDVTSDAAGNVTVRTSRKAGAKSTLGGDLSVWLPPEFDGALDVQQDNGETDLAFTAAAQSVMLDSANGSCRVRAARPSDISLFCENGELDVGLVGVPASLATGRIETGNGTIRLALPAEKFSVQAIALDGGIVDTGNAEAVGCLVQTASPASKTVSCQGATTADPILSATAAGTSLSDVVMSF